MLLEIITTGTKKAVTDAADLPVGTVTGQIGLLTNLAAAAEVLSSGSTLSITAAVTLQQSESLPVIWDGARWRQLIAPNTSLLQTVPAAFDDVQPVNSVAVALVEGDLVLSVADDEGVITTHTVAADA